MKTYYEITENVFSRRDLYEKQKRRRRALALKTAAPLCLLFVCTFFLFLALRKEPLSFISFPFEEQAPITDAQQTPPLSEIPVTPEPGPDPTPVPEPVPEPEPIMPPVEPIVPGEDYGIGGDHPDYSWMYMVDFGIMQVFENLGDPETVERWNNQFSHINPEGNRDPNTEHNIYNFIHELDIPREKFEKANLLYAELNYEPMYTEEEIDLLYSNNETKVYAHFANPYGVQIGKIVYTPEWLETHTAEEYREVGITPALLAETLSFIEQNYIFRFCNIPQSNRTTYDAIIDQYETLCGIEE